MAVYRPTLLGNTEVDIAPFFGGFVDKGAAQMNQAVQNYGKVLIESKNKAFEQAQNLRDGIVSGHFSDAMASDVEGYIKELSELPTYSKEYAAKLAAANADLGIKVSKQSKITTEIADIEQKWSQDPSKIYYDQNALGARMHDQLNGDTEQGIEATGINTTSEDLQGALTDYKRNVNNIKDGEVRKTFQSQLGEIVSQVDRTGGLENENSEFVKFTKNSDGTKFVTGFKYDAQNKMYVPDFDITKLPPMGLVELYRGIDGAASILMDDYVNNKHRTTSDDPDAPINDSARQTYEREFVLEEMKKLAPGGQQKSSTATEYRSRPQDPLAGSGRMIDMEKNHSTVNDMLNSVDRLKNLDPAQLSGGPKTVPFVKVDINGNGNPIQMLDISGSNQGGYNVARTTYKNIQSGALTEAYVKPEKTYLSIDPDDGERTVYFETTNSDGKKVYTIYNDRTATQFVQNVTKGIYNSQDYYDDWAFINKRRGVQSSDGGVNRQIKLSDSTPAAQAEAIEKGNRAEKQAQERGVFDAPELTNSLNTNNRISIKEALLPVNKFFEKTGYDQSGLTDRNGKRVTDKKVKFVKFDQFGTQVKNMINSYGKLTYRVINDDGSLGEPQTVDYNTKDIVADVSGGQGSFDLNAEK